MRRNLLSHGAVALVALSLGVVGTLLVANGDDDEPTAIRKIRAPDCGRIAGYAYMTDPNSPEIDCMRKALRDEEIATIRVDGQTPEGDPIPQVLFLNADGSLSITTDTRRDRLGPQEVRHRACDRVPWLDSTPCP